MHWNWFKVVMNFHFLFGRCGLDMTFHKIHTIATVMHVSNFLISALFCEKHMRTIQIKLFPPLQALVDHLQGVFHHKMPPCEVAFDQSIIFLKFLQVSAVIFVLGFCEGD